MLSAGAMALLAGCVGDTDPPSNVRARQAQLNAHGHTNNGPATWWWEYGVSRTAVAGGQGKQTPHQGPASSSSDVNLNTVVTGLDRSQAYYARACGQDQAAGSQRTCGKVVGLYTAPADSTVRLINFGTVQLTGATTVRHDVVVEDDGGLEEFEDPSTSPPTGSALIPTGGQCVTRPSVQFTSRAFTPYQDHVYCFNNSDVIATLGPYDDVWDARATARSQQVDLGAGNDVFDGSSFGDRASGGPGNDTLVGELGNSFLDGGTGDDAIFPGPDPNQDVTAGDGNDTIRIAAGGSGIIRCGPGTDVVYYPFSTGFVGYGTDGQCEAFAPY